ncbi:FAD-dependent oxidoreductase [Aspergillus clavatus NRRL 1]|uniref:Monooxygenase, putative n=1 Tax=Aspergillus clavatus (strain ATCC 1007 / CBS 513.65 / DSM 816 / NCTC 3887 / NRRL 1 / QM 1276 / 107) TaxID=344612 RepID=A1CUS2_ASPCL|nr:monooxygenase, putative [Aspergillus clavatus NRRL 1]EAW07059.1 monooxygenase, putative [Aspergillus clavatus NRRL 1]
MSYRILIAGGGIAGLTASIALAKELAEEPEVQIAVFESRTEDAIGDGGAISLTPIAQYHLDELGVLAELNRMGDDGGVEVDEINILSLRSGRSLGPLRFADDTGRGYGRYKSRRVLRHALFRAMLAVARKYACISVVCDKKLVTATKTADAVTLRFEDGTTATGDLLLGCDGVHSVVRTQLVDPGNHSEYTGISFIQSLAPTDRVTRPPHFDQTAIHLTRQGSLLASHCNASRQTTFVAAIMRVNEFIVERYRAMASPDSTSAAHKSARMALRYQVRSKFGVSAFPWVRDWIDQTHDWVLYPIYQVQQRRKWYIDRVLLLGDAAHAMPPREESAAYAIEDAMLFARILAEDRDRALSEVFLDYEDARRSLVDKAFDTTRKLWQSDLDKGFFPGHFRDCMSSIQLAPGSPRDIPSDRDCDPSRKRIFPPPTHESMSDLSVYSLTSELEGMIQAEEVGITKR